MAQKDMLRTLELEEQDLHRELRQTPAFKRLEAIRHVIGLYKETPSPRSADVRSSGSRNARSGKSIASTIAEGAEEFLRNENRRYTSGPLSKALMERGINIPGKKSSARLASVLASRRKIFNNVEGKGYGLVEWRDTDPSEDSPDGEAPDPARSDAPKSNGGLPLDY